MKIINRVFEVGMWIGFIALAVSTLVWRFENIDMTETRLLVTYWKQYAVWVGFVIACGIGKVITDNG